VTLLSSNTSSRPADLATKELCGLINFAVLAKHGRDFAITTNGPSLAASPVDLQLKPVTSITIVTQVLPIKLLIFRASTD
jgi:hypothetical protein